MTTSIELESIYDKVVSSVAVNPDTVPKLCEMKDCKNVAEWMPILEFRAFENSLPIRAGLGLPVCELHKGLATVETYLSDAGWQQVVDALRAMQCPPPVRQFTTLTHQKV